MGSASMISGAPPGLARALMCHKEGRQRAFVRARERAVMHSRMRHQSSLSMNVMYSPCAALRLCCGPRWFRRSPDG